MLHWLFILALVQRSHYRVICGEILKEAEAMSQNVKNQDSELDAQAKESIMLLQSIICFGISLGLAN